MHAVTALSLFGALAAALPTSTSTPSVTVDKIVFAGSGCPAGSVDGYISDDRTFVVLLYDQLIAESGKGLSADHYRKNCQVNLKLNYPSGWQFSVLKAQYNGYARIPSGETGVQKATYYFSGQSDQTSSQTTITGPFQDNYSRTDIFDIESTVWSPCGSEALLNINSEVRLSPEDSSKAGALTVASSSLKFKQVHYLQWQTC